MAQEKGRTEEAIAGAGGGAVRAGIPRVSPQIEVTANEVAVEFRIEDLIRRVIPSAAGHCGGCYGCSGCSH